jgi:hypothetical protein
MTFLTADLTAATWFWHNHTPSISNTRLATSAKHYKVWDYGPAVKPFRHEIRGNPPAHGAKQVEVPAGRKTPLREFNSRSMIVKHRDSDEGASQL